MKLIRHGVAALLIFALMTTLLVGIFSDMEENYDITINGTIDNESVAQKLNNINLIGGINNLATAMYKLFPPTGADQDIIGALAAAAIGSLQLVGGVVTAPVDIFGVITQYYTIPSIVPTIIGLLTIIYVAFILLSAHLGMDV